MKKADIMAMARFHIAEQRLREEIQALKEKMGQNSGFSSYYGFDNGIGLEIPLAAYVAMFPKAEPVAKSYVGATDGKLHVWHEWPWQSMGDLTPGFTVWVKAETKSTAIENDKLPTPLDKAAVSESVAA